MKTLKQIFIDIYKKNNYSKKELIEVFNHSLKPLIREWLQQKQYKYCERLAYKGYNKQEISKLKKLFSVTIDELLEELE